MTAEEIRQNSPNLEDIGHRLHRLIRTNKMRADRAVAGGGESKNKNKIKKKFKKIKKSINTKTKRRFSNEVFGIICQEGGVKLVRIGSHTQDK